MRKLCSLIFALQVVSFANAEGPGLGAVLLAPTKLQIQPESRSPRLNKEYLDTEVFFVLGTSQNKEWYKILHRSGIAGWVSNSKIRIYNLNAEEQREFDLFMERDRRPNYRSLVQLGGSYGTAPFGGGAELDLAINMLPYGVFGKNFDQLELGSGFHYHFGGSGFFFEVPIVLQWMFRISHHGNILLGPFGGLSVVQDPRFKFDSPMPARFGLQLRYYFSEHLGLYGSLFMLSREVQNSFASGGLSLRI